MQKQYAMHFIDRSVEMVTVWLYGKFLLSKYYYSKFYEILVLSSKFSLRVSLEAW